MDFRQLDRGELLAVRGGAILGVSVFLAWFTLAHALSWLRGGMTAIIAIAQESAVRKPPGLP